MDADRRSDPRTRTRVDSLERRYRTVARSLVAGMVLFLIAVLLGFALLQGQRWDSVRDGCERTNRQTEAALGLLSDLHVRQAVIDVAKRRYPHLQDCGAYADERVGWLRL
jgi:hypothetical protein